MKKCLLLALLMQIVSITTIIAQDSRMVLDINLSNYQYPFEVLHFDFKSQSKQLKRMAFIYFQVIQSAIILY